MRLQPREIEISDDAPFAQDSVGFEGSCEALTNFVRQCEGPGVIVVDGAWGSGKTTFLRMWEKHYIREGGSVVHFNAWQSDYFDDVLVSVIEEIRRQLVGADESSERMAAVKQSAIDVMKALIPFGARLATAGIVNLSSDDLKGLSDAAEGLASRKLEAYEASKSSLRKFKTELERFVEQTREEGDGDGPVVIILDELDRCRPSYAIEVLETIKHIFDIEGLIFVLGTDLEQLAGVVAGSYGSEFDARSYLVRFFDVKVNLPEPSDLHRLVLGFLERMDAEDLFPTRRDNYLGNKAGLIDALLEFARNYDLSNRDVQRILASLGTYAATIEDRHVVFPVFAAWLAVIRHHDSALYKNVKSGVISTEEVAEAIRRTVTNGFWVSHQAGVLIAEMLVSMAGHDELDAMGRSPEDFPVIASVGPSDHDNYALHIVESLQKGTFMLRERFLGYIIARMELLEPLNR